MNSYICFYHEYESERQPHERKITDLCIFQNLLYFMLLFRRYTRICKSTSIQVGSFMRLTLLVQRQCSKCIVFKKYVNAKVQPIVAYFRCLVPQQHGTNSKSPVSRSFFSTDLMHSPVIEADPEVAFRKIPSIDFFMFYCITSKSG